MDKNIIQKLKETIAKSTNIGIAVGSQPSIDEMGAALSLYLLLQNANKNVSIASQSDPIVEISSLVGIDKVQKQFGGSAGDLVVSFPYKEGEIEKVSYTLENSNLNIIVKASEQGLSFNEKDVLFRRGSGSIDLLIAVGADTIGELGNVIDEQKLTDVPVINIDNSPTNQGFGDIVLVTAQASSISELMADIVLTLGFSLEPDVSQNLLSGIMSATKNFQEPKTSTLAFEVAAYLMKNGAKRVASDQSGMPRREMPQPQPAPAAETVDEVKKQPEASQQAPVQDAQPAQNGSDTAPTQQDEPPLDWLTPKVYKGSTDV